MDRSRPGCAEERLGTQARALRSTLFRWKIEYFFVKLRHYPRAGLLRRSTKAVRRESPDVPGRGAAVNQISHDLGRYWRKQDAIAKVAGGNKYMRPVGRADDGQIVWRAGTQACPALGDWSG